MQTVCVLIQHELISINVLILRTDVLLNIG